MNRWALIILFIWGCSPRVIHFVNDGSKFNQYHSYLILRLKGNAPQEGSDDFHILQRIEEAISLEMEKRDYVKSSDPDLVIRYEIISSQEVKSSNTSAASRYLLNGYTPGSYNLRTVVESILLIELLNASNKKMVWQASMDLSDLTKSSKRKDVLKSAVETLFDTYLYEAGKSQPNPNLKTDS